MDLLRKQLFEIVQRYRPMTVRQVFYQMVSRGHIPKSETEYKGTVGRLLVEMRKGGEIPYHWIADNTRWMRKPRTYSSAEAMLRDAAESYRHQLWRNQEVYVEVWLEKEALAGVLYDVTRQFDVPLMVSRGYSSISYLHAAAEAIEAQQKPAFLYYFGDHDPSGLDIPRNIERSIREMAPDTEIHFEKLAVLPEQIEYYGLPTRPTKRSDSRSKSFKGESVEVDAIEPDELRRIAHDAIVRHIDQDAYETMQMIEDMERDQLRSLVETLKYGMN